MDLYGYAGKILFVDLTERRFREEPVDAEMAGSFLGGHGFNCRLIHEFVDPLVSPLSPENGIFIGTGPFSGTLVPGSAELTITEKLPLTGGFGTHAGGGHFALMLKSSGYDEVVITGRSQEPVVLVVHEEGVDFRDASELWGKDAFQTVDELRRIHEPCSIIPIGEAGENLVPISVTCQDKLGTLGFGGLPAVMGSKNLKGIVAVQGNRGIKVADPSRLLKSVGAMMKRVMDYKHRPFLIKGGTYAMTAGWLKAQGYDTEAWTKRHVEARKALACPACPMGDKERIRIMEGEFSPMLSHMTHFMAEEETSAATALDNYNRAVKRLDVFNRTGICMLNFRWTLDLMTLLFREGIITKEDTDGIDLDRISYETMLRLIQMTARREGFGELLAEGILGASRRIGREAEQYAYHIKGCGLFIEPRLESMHTMAFSQLVHPGRPNYACGGIGIYMPGRPVEEFRAHGNRIGMTDEELERVFTERGYNTGRLTKHAEDWFSLFNALGQCHRLYIHRFHSIETFMDYLQSVTSMEMDRTTFLQCGERIWNLHKLLNVRAGLGRQDDLPPKQWFEPLETPRGQFVLRDYFSGEPIGREDVERNLDEYYDERGWEISTGEPTPAKLKELGLETLSTQP